MNQVVHVLADDADVPIVDEQRIAHTIEIDSNDLGSRVAAMRALLARDPEVAVVYNKARAQLGDDATVTNIFRDEEGKIVVNIAPFVNGVMEMKKRSLGFSTVFTAKQQSTSAQMMRRATDRMRYQTAMMEIGRTPYTALPYLLPYVRTGALK